MIDRLPQLSLPELIIHEDKDDIFPIEFWRQVFDAATPAKKWYVIQATNITTPNQVGGGAYFHLFAEFVRKAGRV